MKTVTSKSLANSYVQLYPEELVSPNNSPRACFSQIEEILENWLFRYSHLPETTISNSSWNGKVTKALFHALEIRKPKSVKNMLIILRGEFGDYD
jgi:hypothetical protein